jgi:hypothetical protein
MAGVTMCASTFLNAQQTDYDTFRRETLEIIEYVRQHRTDKSGRAAKPAGQPTHA